MTTPALDDLKHVPGTGIRARVQRFGAQLAGMIMPNIAAFIAWGLITALFIPAGWLPNETLAKLVGPMITVLLPVLIGYTGGRLVHGQRGAVVGAVATIGVVVGTDVPMFLGAMLIGPLTAYLLKLVDDYLAGRTKAGFEMLVANFSAGILGGAMAVAGALGVGPVVQTLTKAAGSGVDALVSSNLLPLVSIIVEPAKVLFLNNALNHGVLAPLGVQQVTETGKSVLFMIETNPGPGLGILIAYLLFGPRLLRPSVPGAMVIHFLGGIHEIYFPYVLMKPRLILAAIAGGAAGVGTSLATGAGLVATPSPGSIFAYLAVTPKGGYFGVLAAIVVATGVSFVVAAALLGFGRSSAEQAADSPPETVPDAGPAHAIEGKGVTGIVVACDAGMGSSVMLAGQLTKRLKPYGVSVTHKSINEIPAGTELVLTHTDLAARARQVAPGAVVVEFTSFLGDPAFDRVEAAIREGGEIRG
ncbi:PTS system, mannitol-specific IIC component [Actinokineospora alba]|uniref:PTS system mannitol-specific EIICB component n=1 Tax=Actinokineospora alba TaxID=504798 RepID=A0A1H0VR29_9PSEU|nr:PTS mannitol transporter subunit IICB [Actinokineospora alba]TDP70143.1 PTS system mannitol-specific IIC component [Actinokineospora alba]SDI38047.1 PTS system, mannitol-specific IIC component [Actinokineospora alba]SDP81042.1 PTS system, mannitol-specific IIC component [Actinokineospora alba]